MQANDPTVGYSPVSESTSVTISSPSRSPVPRPQNDRSNGSLGGGDVAMTDAQYAHDMQASRACEKCRASKRKCDKKLPSCDRCKRLNAKCYYVQDPNFNNSSPNNAQVVFLPQSHSLASDLLFRGAEPLEGITASQILSLVSPEGEPQHDYRHSISLYFSLVHPWYGVVHPTLFYRQLQSLGPAESLSPSDIESSPFSHSTVDHQVTSQKSQSSHTGSPELASKEFALLAVLMNLNIRMRLTDAGEQQMFDETYRTVKRTLALLLMVCADGPRPTVELVQCGALMALYEYGHGEIETAYQTLSQTAPVARVLGISATQKGESGIDDVPLTLEEEQRNCLWWGLFILEQFILQDDNMRHLPFVFESPSRTTLLPESQIESRVMSSSPGASTQLIPTLASPRPTLPSARLLTTDVIVGSQKLGSFQLSAKAASIFHKALWIDKERRKWPGEKPHVSTFNELDSEIRTVTGNILGQSLDWETKLDCFAMLIGSLFVLYTPFLTILERSTPAAIESDPELTVALTALRFACKMSTEISCKINTDFETPSRSPAVLCAPAGASCYRVILAYACISRIFPEESEACQKAISEKFESLWLFSFRWGFAEKMMRRLEYRIGVDRNYYLRNTSITPPPRSTGYELLQ
ncbi:putative fungal specific transcription protein [Rosellinia necatrix]|uniref:Putative fungal specific transcription protein n=1 Tax=Rosellinia necatrix TaxID=77044 RepID=A0A1W2TCW4_ROSNE|nr:putative fungal specific transcription protein [Rosellinia necatrix]